MNLYVTKYNTVRISSIMIKSSKNYKVFSFSWKVKKSEIRQFDSSTTICNSHTSTGQSFSSSGLYSTQQRYLNFSFTTHMHHWGSFSNASSGRHSTHQDIPCLLIYNSQASLGQSFSSLVDTPHSNRYLVFSFTIHRHQPVSHSLLLVYTQHNDWYLFFLIYNSHTSVGQSFLSSGRYSTQHEIPYLLIYNTQMSMDQ